MNRDPYSIGGQLIKFFNICYLILELNELEIMFVRVQFVIYIFVI